MRKATSPSRAPRRSSVEVGEVADAGDSALRSILAIRRRPARRRSLDEVAAGVLTLDAAAVTAGARPGGGGPPPAAGGGLRATGRARADIGPVRIGAAFDDHRGRRRPRAGIGAGRLGDAARQRGELHRLQEGDELRPVRRLQHEVVQPVRQRHVVLQPHQLARDARLVGVVDERLRGASPA